MDLLSQDKINTFKRFLRSGNRRGLDIGCGNGWLSRMFNTIGLDLSLPQKEKRTRNFQFFNGDAHFLPFKSETFDFVIISEVLEHVAEPLTVLKEANFILKQKGIALISVPNGKGLYMLFATKLPERILKRKIHVADNYINLDFLVKSIRHTNFLLNQIEPTFLFFGFFGFCMRIFDKFFDTRIATSLFKLKKSRFISLLLRLDKSLLRRTSLNNADGWYIKASKL